MILERNGAMMHEFWRFSLVGVAAFLVNAGLVEMLAPWIGPACSQMFAFPVAATAAWWLNRRFTFRGSGLLPHREWLRYVVANSVGWLMNNATYLLIISHLSLASAHPSLAVAAGSVSGLTANFFLSRRIVFNKKGC